MRETPGAVPDGRAQFGTGLDGKHRDGEPAFSDRYTVPAGEGIEDPDVVSAGEYPVTVTLDSGATASVAFTMHGCTDDDRFVSVDESGDLEAGVPDEC